MVCLNKNAVYPASINDYGPNALALLSDYNVTEQVSSGYVMNTLDIGQSTTLILGVRVEKESNDYGAINSDRSVGGTGSVSLITGRTSGHDCKLHGDNLASERAIVV